MEINKNLINTIEIFVTKCENFDKSYKNMVKIINNQANDNLDELYDVTNYYIELRACHGKIIKLYDSYKNCKLDNEEYLYNLSVLNSIIGDVGNMIQNVDFQYKQFATFFPKLVSKDHLTVLLVVNKNETEEDKKFINMLNEIKANKYENKYKIMKCGKKEGLELKIKSKNQKIKLLPKSTPMMYLIKDDIISEIKLKNIENKKMLENILS